MSTTVAAASAVATAAVATAVATASSTILPSPILSNAILQNVWVSVGCGIIGGVLTFLGYRIFRLAAFFCAFCIGFVLWYVFSPHMFTTSICCGPNGKEWVHYLTSSIVGLVFGLLAMFLIRVGVFMIGACLGIVIATIAMSTPLATSSFFASNAAYGTFYALCALATGIVACLLEKLTIILATSIGGAFAVFLAIDYWVQSNFSKSVEMFLQRVAESVQEGFQSRHTNVSTVTQNYAWNGKDFGMCVGWAILSLFGIYIQFVYTSRNVSHRKTKDKAKKLEAQVKEQQRALQKQNELVVPLLAAQEPDAMEMRPVT